MHSLLFALALAFSPVCDADGDGHLADSPTCGGDDCHDLDALVHPGILERCNGVDDDCNGETDEVPGMRADADGDGFFVGLCASQVALDCDDTDPNVFPRYNGEDPATIGVDDDCDGLTDEDDLDHDDDGDGNWENGGPYSSFDCDDSDPSRSFLLDEVPDGVDNDCDGSTDEGLDTVDLDNDGFTAIEGDCDDTRAEINATRAEICDGIDNDCDGRLASSTSVEGPELDRDGDGVLACAGDCDDGDPNVGPHRLEVPGNGVDDDCDGSTDAAVDMDLDGFDSTLDCDDGRLEAHPGAAELENGLDDDCDGAVDEDFDIDRDGFTTSEDPDDTNAWITPDTPPWCTSLDGIDADGDGWDRCLDCDDADPSRHPSAPEGDNGRDDDCDGAIDEGVDADGDGFTPRQGDCDDTLAGVNPLAVEVGCNALDDDCDDATPDVVDADGDGETCDVDCDDDDDGRHPGADEVCGDGVDQDCSGADLACDDTGTPATLDTGDTDPTDDTGETDLAPVEDTGEVAASALPSGWFCSAAPGPAGWLGLLLGAGLARRRR